ncbi:cargo receptor for soluble protein [Schizosaccharomyces japonicus yFS275]|uniref:Cargo receptor for soluble protein n=1 Tax=Schizosaccharomyces japonicus (strain yFS275 / FY16936) TaxID=402676 RepID=B6K1K9_SCHJY|nr:cargo receptor for soluble protein [Schizosaccharomyces japonicus yFS275]EEB07040.1 cargo receptor for soluble protein [Schizosaccharomyces japonicus yFS275]
MTSRSHFSSIPLSNPNRRFYGQPPAGPSNVGRSQRSMSERLSQVWEQTEEYFEPVKPYLTPLGRFLIIATFFEDSFRICTQWGDQVAFMRDYRRFRFGTAPLLLFINVILMFFGSLLVVIKRKQMYAIASLLFVVVLQTFCYGLLFDVDFFFRNLSVIGGLVLVAGDTFIHHRVNRFAGLPAVSETNKRTYFQLTGRVLLIFMFIGLLAKETNRTPTRILVHIMSAIACVMVVIGFKAKVSATILVFILSISNFIINSFWTLPKDSPHRDFYRYDFFQTLSIIGGLLYLVNTGPGKISVDEKKKFY